MAERCKGMSLQKEDANICKKSEKLYFPLPGASGACFAGHSDAKAESLEDRAVIPETKHFHARDTLNSPFDDLYGVQFIPD